MKSLKHKKTISKIFDEGTYSTHKKPYKITIKEINSEFKGVVICVSVKKFKRAVDRNLIKRYIREGLKGKETTRTLAIIYSSDELPNKSLIDQISKII